MDDKFVNGTMLNNFAKKLKSNIKSDLLDGKKLKYVTQAEYDALTDDEKNDENIIYNITDANIEEGFSGDYNDLTNKPTIPTVTNDLTNELKANYDAAYTHSQAAHAPSDAQKNSDITKAEIEAKLTGTIDTHTHAVASASADGLMSASDKVKLTGISPGANNYTHPDKHEASIITQDSTHLFVTQTEKNTWNNKLSEIPAEYITETELNAKGYLTEHQDISGKADKSELFSKDYNDLTNKPTIPSIDGLATETYVNNKLANLQIVQITKVEYDALTTKDPNTLYLIVG